MAKITIPCIDSIGYLNPHWLYVDGVHQNTVAGVRDDEYLWWDGIKYYLGYLEDSAVACYSGVRNYPSVFSFQSEDLSFLNSASILSATLNFRVGYTAANKVQLYALTVKPIIQPGYFDDDGDIPGYYTQLEVLSKANLFYTVEENLQYNQDVEIDLTNNISIIKNLVNYGLRISAMRGDSTAGFSLVFGARSQYRPTITIEYLSDETPPIVTPSSPVSDVVNGDQPITFTWNYSQDVNEPQSHYSIQQQTSSGWQNLIPKTAGTAHTATVPAGTFTAGQAAWRVMVWSQNGTVASQWSDPAYIIVQSQPKAPNITSAGTSPSPTFTWQASQQQGYEIKLGDYYDAIQFGVEKSWTYPGTLPDGNVIFQIRIQNAQGIWSPWAGVETYISNMPQGTLSLSANVLNQSVSLTWIGTGFTSSQYNVYRGGELIATVSGTSFTDYYSAGKHTYQVYAMLSGGYYTPSNAITEIVRPKYAMISLVSSISWIPLRIRSGGRPTYSSENQAQASFVHYQGRVLPVAYTTGFLDKSYSYSFSFLRKEDMQTLAKLCGQMVILKTPAGERVAGILTGISDSRQQRINDFSFSITEADFSEVDLNAANNVKVSSFP